MKTLMICVALSTSLLLANVAQAQTTETFDDDPASRGWVGTNNSTFGFSNTGNVASAGEGGGTIPRFNGARSYGADIGSFTLDDHLSATVQFNLVGEVGSGIEAFIGFVDRNNFGHIVAVRPREP